MDTGGPLTQLSRRPELPPLFPISTEPLSCLVVLPGEGFGQVFHLYELSDQRTRCVAVPSLQQIGRTDRQLTTDLSDCRDTYCAIISEPKRRGAGLPVRSNDVASNPQHLADLDECLADCLTYRDSVLGC